MCLYPEQQAEYDHLMLRYNEWVEGKWPEINWGWVVGNQVLAQVVPSLELFIQSYLSTRRSSAAHLKSIESEVTDLERELPLIPCDSQPYLKRLIELTRIAMNLARQDSRLD